MIPVRSAVLVIAIAACASMAGGQDTPPPMSPRVAELVKQLKDPDWDTRMEAATALATLGPESLAAIPDLVAALADPVAAVRMKAIDALMFMGTGAAGVAPRIVPLLGDPDELVRLSVVVALPRMTPNPSSTAPLLKKALADKAWSVRRRSALELIEMGAEVPAAVPVLREGLKDPILTFRLEAAAALAPTASPRERAALMAIVAEPLKDADPDNRVQAVRRLSVFGKEAVPYLLPILKTDQSREVQMSALRTLARMGPEAGDALPSLQEVQQGKGIWLKASQRAIAAIEGKEPPPPPQEVVGPVPPLPTPPSPSAPPPR